VKLPEEEYFMHCRDYDGYCKVCDCVTVFGGVEPDADHRKCDDCGLFKVMGVEQALIAGHIEIDG
jgi:hypothetical protein